MRLGGTRGNDPDVLASPSVDNHEQTASGAHAERDKSLLFSIGFVVRDGDRVGIVQNWNRFWHPNTVPAKVNSRLARFIPLEAHDPSVRIFCAYVNSVRVASQGEPFLWEPRRCGAWVGLAHALIEEGGVEISILPAVSGG